MKSRVLFGAMLSLLCTFAVAGCGDDKIIDIDIPDTPGEPSGSEELPDEAKFKLKMVQITPLMNLDASVAAPFDFMTFRIVDNQDVYYPVGFPDFLQYYDSIVMVSPVMPDSYCIYKKKPGHVEFTHQWGSYFFENETFQISLKGYKDNVLRYETTMNQLMCERDFLGIDWKGGDIVLANPKANGAYCILDNRYEFVLTDTQMLNETCYVTIYLAYSYGLSDAEFIEKQEAGLTWLLDKHLGEAASIDTSVFKTLPADADIVKTYENSTTLAALLHQQEDDTHEECYYVLAEAK